MPTRGRHKPSSILLPPELRHKLLSMWEMLNSTIVVSLTCHPLNMFEHVSIRRSGAISICKPLADFLTCWLLGRLFPSPDLDLCFMFSVCSVKHSPGCLAGISETLLVHEPVDLPSNDAAIDEEGQWACCIKMLPVQQNCSSLLMFNDFYCKIISCVMTLNHL